MFLPRAVKRAVIRLPYVRTLVAQRDQAIREREQLLQEREQLLQELAFDRDFLMKDRLAAAEELAKGRVVDAFHRLYYGSARQTWLNTFWLGVRTLKYPIDLWIYQELLCTVNPTLIIETGTADGGSALFLASVFDLLNHGRIVSIDIRNVGDRLAELPVHQRIRYIGGSSVSPEITERIQGLIEHDDRVMVILDSDHSKAHVLEELRLYSEFVSLNSYLIVEDTNLNGHPVYLDHGEGPWEALEAFMAHDERFVVDRTAEKFLFTANPGGYLKRVS